MSEFLKDLVCYCGGINVFIMLFITDCIDLLMGLVGLMVVNWEHRSYKFITMVVHVVNTCQNS